MAAKKKKPPESPAPKKASKVRLVKKKAVRTIVPHCQSFIFTPSLCYKIYCLFPCDHWYSYLFSVSYQAITLNLLPVSATCTAGLGDAEICAIKIRLTATEAQLSALIQERASVRLALETAESERASTRLALETAVRAGFHTVGTGDSFSKTFKY